MANWHDVVGYLRANYRIAEERADRVTLDFTVGGGRSQRVHVWRMTLVDGAEEWAQIESAVGELESVDLVGLLQAVGSLVCGGLGSAGTLVTYRHTVPLENLDVNELERPLSLVTVTADELEQRFAGGDSY